MKNTFAHDQECGLQGHLVCKNCTGEKSPGQGDAVLGTFSKWLRGDVAGKMEERGRIVEHPVGTLKSRCGLYRFLMGGGLRNAG